MSTPRAPAPASPPTAPGRRQALVAFQLGPGRGATRPWFTPGQALAAFLLALLAVVIWGATFTVTKQLLRELRPMAILFARFVVGYAALWVLHPRRLPWQGLATEVRMALMGGLGVTLYFFFENLALVHGSAGMVSVVVCTSPVLTALLPALVGRGQRLTPGYWLGFALAAGGVLLTVSGGDLSTLSGAWLGAVLAVAGAFTWSLYTLLSQALPKGLNQLALTRRTFFWGILAMLPLCLPEWRHWDLAPFLLWHNAWRVLGLGLIAGAGCYAAWSYAVSRLGGLQTSLLLYLNPVVGVLAAALVLGERLTGLILLGVCLTLAGVAVSSLSTHR